MTTDLTILAKTELNAMLTAPLNASALKKTGKPDLIRMILAQDAAPAPTTDAPAAPTLQAVLDGLTAFEKAVLVAHLDAGMECNGAETHDAMQADNMTWSDVAETSKRTGLTKKQVNGVLTSLSGKGLVVTDCDPVNGEGPVQQVLSDWGISAAFELLADGIEAKAAPKPAKAPASPAPKKARGSAFFETCERKGEKGFVSICMIDSGFRAVGQDVVAHGALVGRLAVQQDCIGPHLPLVIVEVRAWFLCFNQAPHDPVDDQSEVGPVEGLTLAAHPANS